MTPSPFTLRNGWLYVPQTAVLLPMLPSGLGRVYATELESGEWGVMAADLTIYEGTETGCRAFVARLAEQALGPEPYLDDLYGARA